MKKISKKTIKATLDKFGYCKKASIKKKAKNIYLLKNAEIDRLPLLTVIKAELGSVRVIQKSMKKFELVFIDTTVPDSTPATEKSELASTEEIMDALGDRPASKLIRVSHWDLVVSKHGASSN